MLGILFWGWFAFWYLRELREWFGGTGLKTLSYKLQTVSYTEQTLSHRERMLSYRQQMLNHSERTASEGGPYKSGPHNSRPDKTGGVGDRGRRRKRMRRRIRKSGSRSTP